MCSSAAPSPQVPSASASSRSMWPSPWPRASPTVAPYIISNPEAGWGPAPAAITQQVQSEVSNSLSSKAGTRTSVSPWTAGRGRRCASQFLLIMLVKFPGTTVPSSANVTTAADDVCTGAGGAARSRVVGPGDCRIRI